MHKATIPANEVARLEALRALEVLDTPAEERFDRLTRIAQYILQVPIVLISLVDAERQWFKSRQGLDATETPRDISFCGHAIMAAEVFVVPDAAADPRFSDNPLVTQAPDIRFYAGAPLTLSNGHNIGTLCAIDRVPRQVSAEQLAALRDLAKCVSEELERERERRRGTVAALNQARYLAIIESSTDAIISKTLDGIVTSWNAAAEGMFGYSESEMLGQPMARLIPPDRADEEPRLLDRLRRGEHIDHFETLRKKKNGELFPASVTLSPIKDQSGAIVGASKIVRDISERKATERMKSEFVSTVSHELRTPLTSIRGALGLVLGKFSGDLPQKVRLLLETANRNSERLVLLINDILDLDKIHAGQMTFDCKSLDLVSLAQQAIAANEGYGQEHGVALTLMEVPPTAVVWGDEHRLLQVFANLFSNAVKFSPKGGIVEVSVRSSNGRVRVGIRDTGSGIPEEFRGRVFQRFAQADSSNTRDKGGTGLGLSITLAIIEKHGGTIDFTSQEGQGTEFFFALPESREPFKQVPIANSHPRNGLHQPGDRDKLRHALSQALSHSTRPRILHVEDDLDIVQITQALLDEDVVYTYTTTIAAAKQELARSHFDLLLLDLVLPDGFGLELLSAIGPDTQVIVFSGQDPGAALRQRITATLTKGTTSNERLLATIRQAISQRRKGNGYLRS